MSNETNNKCVTLGLEPSFGFGDRIGLATPGHVASMNLAGGGIQPIYPQQSIREMARTGREPEGVMADAMNGAASCRNLRVKTAADRSAPAATLTGSDELATTI